MDNYLYYHDAIREFQQKGYNEDFVLFGNDLFWIQQKIFINESNYNVQECLQLGHPLGNDQDLVIVAITIPERAKGILMNHYSFSREMPAVIFNKLKKLSFRSMKLRTITGTSI